MQQPSAAGCTSSSRANLPAGGWCIACAPIAIPCNASQLCIIQTSPEKAAALKAVLVQLGLGCSCLCPYCDSMQCISDPCQPDNPT